MATKIKYAYCMFCNKGLATDHSETGYTQHKRNSKKQYFHKECYERYYKLVGDSWTGGK